MRRLRRQSKFNGYNQIKDIFSLIELDNLAEVYLFNNQISDLPQFDSAQLQILDLRKNQIVEYTSNLPKSNCSIKATSSSLEFITVLFPGLSDKNVE